MKKPRRSDCPINFAVELFGDKWTFLIVRDMMFKGKHHFGDFLRSEENIATNILADRLIQLERAHIVARHVDPLRRSRYLYTLTRKGIDLLPVLVDLIQWSAKYDRDSAADTRFVSRIKRGREALIEEHVHRLKQELATISPSAGAKSRE